MEFLALFCVCCYACVARLFYDQEAQDKKAKPKKPLSPKQQAIRKQIEDNRKRRMEEREREVAENTAKRIVREQAIARAQRGHKG